MPLPRIDPIVKILSYTNNLPTDNKGKYFFTVNSAVDSVDLDYTPITTGDHVDGFAPLNLMISSQILKYSNRGAFTVLSGGFNCQDNYNIAQTSKGSIGLQAVLMVKINSIVYDVFTFYLPYANVEICFNEFIDLSVIPHLAPIIETAMFAVKLINPDSGKNKISMTNIPSSLDGKEILFNPFVKFSMTESLITL